MDFGRAGHGHVAACQRLTNESIVAEETEEKAMPFKHVDDDEHPYLTGFNPFCDLAKMGDPAVPNNKYRHSGGVCAVLDGSKRFDPMKLKLKKEGQNREFTVRKQKSWCKTLEHALKGSRQVRIGSHSGRCSDEKGSLIVDTFRKAVCAEIVQNCSTVMYDTEPRK